ncbi:MAG TPA: iron-containing alcohol dehydrogenase [Burkholderiales bacterium]|nr:iron-containing alcohol dehydrogenase [Burkholderiales bacterium]
MITGVHHWPAQERVIYGKPAAEALMDEVARAGAKHVFVTTTRSITNGALVARVIEALGNRFSGKFDAIAAHSPREGVLAGADAIRASGADLVVAVGGGSVIDATKVMLIAIWRGVKTVEELSSHAGVRGGPGPSMSDWTSDPQSLRMIAIPTTLSAAEFYSGAGVTDVQRRVKQPYLHPLAVPKAVILDPAATLETPLDLMLSTGIRSVDHAVEGWCSVRSTPLADTSNHEAMRLLATALPAIRRDPADLEARAIAQHATWLSRIGTMAGVPHGASHGIGYLLGGGRGVPHGVTSCIALPAVMTWNAQANAVRQAAVSEAFGAPGEPAGEVLRRFITDLGQPTRLREVNIAREELPAIAASWDGSGPIATNPRPVAGKHDLLEILELAY